jgi:hypothetical protein
MQTQTTNYQVTRVGTLHELTGQGHEFLLSSDRSAVIAYLIDGNLFREMPLNQEQADAATVPCAA